MTSSQPDDYTFDSTAYGDVGLELSALISNYPPPFVYIHDSSDGLKVDARVITKLLQKPSEPLQEHGPITKVCCGWADAACCFTQRLLFEALIHSLVGHSPDWDEGCSNWSVDNGSQWNDNLDSFLQGLREAHIYLSKRFGVDSPGAAQGTNRKGKGKEQQYNGIRIVLVVARAERLKESVPELLVSLARLRELVRLDLCVVLSSEVEWDKIKSPLGAAPDPYFVDISPLTKEDTVSLLTASRYTRISSLYFATCAIFTLMTPMNSNTSLRRVGQASSSQFWTNINHN
ncbi:hypothetical protein EST38_g974 [Candolleomyces aberdarensis]|uniref:Uncharacterized protein n=1 Tax=Candolleomyces aberdarensis TaxID=2316362 RepID=A0A4Q2DYE2_9AGAR|nr:hypothetical protein EST38_g974 [Candolleomyces aberdarensis]